VKHLAGAAVEVVEVEVGEVEAAGVVVDLVVEAEAAGVLVPMQEQVVVVAGVMVVVVVAPAVVAGEEPQTLRKVVLVHGVVAIPAVVVVDGTMPVLTHRVGAVLLRKRMAGICRM